MRKHKLGMSGSLHEFDDGTIGFAEVGRLSYSFRVPLAAVVGFTEARASRTQVTLSVLGAGGVIADCKANWGAAERLNRWLTDRRAADRPAPASPGPGPAPGSDELLANLERLGALYSSGVLNDAEFAEAKRRILG